LIRAINRIDFELFAPANQARSDVLHHWRKAEEVVQFLRGIKKKKKKKKEKKRADQKRGREKGKGEKKHTARNAAFSRWILSKLVKILPSCSLSRMVFKGSIKS